MSIQVLQNYTSFTNLTNSLLYLHTTNDIFIQNFDTKGKNSLYFFYDSNTKTYNFYFKLLDERVADSFIKLEKEKNYFKLQNKDKFLVILKSKINTLISIMQKLWYKFIHDPEVDLLDLQNIDSLVGLDTDNDENNDFDLETSVEKQKKIHLNNILLYHNIMWYSLIREPYESDWFIKIRINELDYNHISLFPQENKKLSDIQFTITWTPNIYFPNLVTLCVIKQFNYKNTAYQIIYDSQITIQKIWKIAKQYYLNFNKSKKSNPELLNFSIKLVEIIKNPYYSSNFKKDLTSNDVIEKSQCKKCGSKSSIFLVTFWDVTIKTKMGAYEKAILFPDNIITYKEILTIQCYECGNNLVENKKRLENYELKRNYLGEEDWTSAIHHTPILDDIHGREVLVNYDLLTVEVEFDLTNPLLPNMHYLKIINTGKVIWWTEPENKQYKSFYKYN